MTYEEYKNSKKGKNKPSFLKRLASKVLVVIILVICIMIVCNYSPKFNDFINEKVLGDTFNFSKINQFINNLTNKDKEDKSVSVMEEIDNKEEKLEEYLDGFKYFVKTGDKINLKESGIVTFIGEKEGYNNTVIVQQSNGYYAWYGNIKEEVKLYDYITKGNSLGEALSDEYYFALFKDGEPVEINNNEN